jgi:hypothetical protein
MFQDSVGEAVFLLAILGVQALWRAGEWWFSRPVHAPAKVGDFVQVVWGGRRFVCFVIGRPYDQAVCQPWNLTYDTPSPHSPISVNVHAIKRVTVRPSLTEHQARAINVYHGIHCDTPEHSQADCSHKGRQRIELGLPGHQGVR